MLSLWIHFKKPPAKRLGRWAMSQWYQNVVYTQTSAGKGVVIVRHEAQEEEFLYEALLNHMVNLCGGGHLSFKQRLRHSLRARTFCRLENRPKRNGTYRKVSTI